MVWLAIAVLGMLLFLVLIRGVFYILPDKAPLAETFPEFAQSRASTPRRGLGSLR